MTVKVQLLSWIVSSQKALGQNPLTLQSVLEMSLNCLTANLSLKEVRAVDSMKMQA